MNKLKNIEKAAQRIKLAVQQKERIILYGDSDMDGICSVVILEEAIKNLGGSVSEVMFPDRETDGYGINLRALDVLKDKTPVLFITLDLGIGNIKEVDLANAMGLEVIVIDHHDILESVPRASVVVDPKQPGDDSKLTHLANVGVTFKLCEELLQENFSPQLKNSFLELTALATISDMVPQIEDNKVFIEEGLRSLKNTFRPGLKAFFDTIGYGELVAGGFMKIIACLNSAESKDFQNDGYVILTSSSERDCKELAEKLVAKVLHKQQKIREISEEVERRISQKKDDPIIFEGDPAWRLILAGSVASIVSGRYQKPTFIFRKGDIESSGSVRSPKDDQNSVEAMASCKDLLITYGGHPKASGFRIKNENLEKFKEGLIKHFSKLTPTP
jgi:single-stranded-DNA-specific exonuclease